jgi:hypothetical protein
MIAVTWAGVISVQADRSLALDGVVDVVVE